MKIVFEYEDFWSTFTKTSKNSPIFSGDISRFFLLQANLSLKACLAMCLIFRENPGSRAYKRVAYKKKNVYTFGIQLDNNYSFTETSSFSCVATQ